MSSPITSPSFTRRRPTSSRAPRQSPANDAQELFADAASAALDPPPASSCERWGGSASAASRGGGLLVWNAYPPTPDPSPPLRSASRGEGSGDAAAIRQVSMNNADLIVATLRAAGITR